MKIMSGRQSWEGLLAKHFRRIVILCAGCSIFLLLHNVFGGLRYPSFEPMEKFPRKMWQSWKVDPLRFEDRDIERARTWTVKNPGHRYEVLTDDNAMNYVEHYYGRSGFNRPDIVHTYKTLNAKIIQADLLRYLIMYAEGGLYADIDVEALRSIEHFIPRRFDEGDIEMVIGIEPTSPNSKTTRFSAQSHSHSVNGLLCANRTSQ